MLCRELEDAGGIARSLGQLYNAAMTRGDLATARALAEENLAYRRAAGEKVLVAFGLMQLAQVLTFQGEYHEAQALCDESVAMHRVLENRWGLAQSLFESARVLFVSQGAPATVRARIEEGLALCRELGFKQGMAKLLSLSGQVAFSQGDSAAARSLLQDSVTLFKEIGDHFNTAQALSALAKVVARQGDQAAAYGLYQESLACGVTSARLTIAPSLEGLAGVAAAQGELAWAAQLWGAAQALREAFGAPLPPVERADYERVVAAAREQLEERSFTAAWDQGRRMTPEQALIAPGGAPTSATTSMPVSTLHTSSPPAEKAPPAYPDGLTAREVEVLRLVAAGLTSV